jgi:hypothetical protein
MKKLIVVAVLLSSPAVARDGMVKEPVCRPNVERGSRLFDGVSQHSGSDGRNEWIRSCTA